MQLSVVVTNAYDTFEVLEVATVDVPVAPSRSTGHQAWADSHLFSLTGTGRHEGNATYYVEIVECAEQPELVGLEFAWG